MKTFLCDKINPLLEVFHRLAKYHVFMLYAKSGCSNSKSGIRYASFLLAYESSEFLDKTFRALQVHLQVQGVGCRRYISYKPVPLTTLVSSSSLPQKHLIRYRTEIRKARYDIS